MQQDTMIDIVLATYNGEEFIKAQLDSIFAQTHAGWRLLIRDDGSSDRTPDILRSVQQAFPTRVTIIQDDDGNLGYVQNFSRLLEHSTADYIALCDQDDVWKPEKLATSLAKMRGLEGQHGADTPIMVFTDLAVVDDSLEILSESIWKYQYASPDFCGQLNRSLVQNVVTGCSILLNRPLKGMTVPIPKSVSVHDWWIALVVSAFGATGYIDSATVLYRQHDLHSIGARQFHVSTLPKIAHSIIADFSQHRKRMMHRIDQAKAFCEIYGDSLSGDDALVVQRFLDLPREGLFGRARKAIKYNLLPHGLMRSIFFILFFYE